MAAKNKLPVYILIALAVIGGGWFLAQSVSMRPAEPQFALRLPSSLELPEFTLTDQDGQTLTQHWFEGQWTLVFFGFTHCPDICPATLQVMSLARRQLAEDNPDQELPSILLISIDPERDTPASLKQYVTHFGNGVSGATGSFDELEKLTKTLGVYFAKEDPVPGGVPDDYNVAHSAHVVVINPNGDYSAVFSAPHEVAAFVADMPILMAQ
jgi:protein SCO1/2